MNNIKITGARYHANTRTIAKGGKIKLGAYSLQLRTGAGWVSCANVDGVPVEYTERTFTKDGAAALLPSLMGWAGLDIPASVMEAANEAQKRLDEAQAAKERREAETVEKGEAEYLKTKRASAEKSWTRLVERVAEREAAKADAESEANGAEIVAA
jgi:hypothetical protein